MIRLMPIQTMTITSTPPPGSNQKGVDTCVVYHFLGGLPPSNTEASSSERASSRVFRSASRRRHFHHRNGRELASTEQAIDKAHTAIPSTITSLTLTPVWMNSHLRAGRILYPVHH